MKTKAVRLTMGIFFFALFILAGCTAHIQPMVSESEYLTSEPKKTGSAELYISEDFKTYGVSKTDVMDMKKWYFELGPAAVDCFKYALANRFEKVDVKLGKPSLPSQRGDDETLLVIVEPAFSNFDTHFPIAFKFETYVAVVSFRVKAFDKTGKLLFDEVFEGTGKQRGSIGYASAGHAANPVSAKLAIKDAVDKAVIAILKTVESKKE